MTAATPPLTNESVLIGLAIEGNHRAFMTLVGHYDAALRSVVFGVVNSRDDMDDVLQEAYFLAYRNLSKFEQRSSFNTWLYRIAYNCSIDFLRRKPRALFAENASEQDLPPVAAGDDNAVAGQDLLKALLTLSPGHRAAVWLVDVQGVGQTTAAAVLGIPVGTVASRLTTARRTLRAALANYLEGGQR